MIGIIDYDVAVDYVAVAIRDDDCTDQIQTGYINIAELATSNDIAEAHAIAQRALDNLLGEYAVEVDDTAAYEDVIEAIIGLIYRP